VKFQPDQLDGVNAVSAYTRDSLNILGTVWRQSIIVPARGQVTAWDCPRWEDLRESHFEALLAFEPELVIFGSGSKLRFPPPALYRCLIERRIGIESMDTQAASRTYNILVAEGRKALGAFLLDAAKA
jgi:uncharacterized protein